MNWLEVELNEDKNVFVMYSYVIIEGVWRDLDGCGYPDSVDMEIQGVFFGDDEYTSVIERCDSIYGTKYMDKIISEIEDHETR